MNYLVSRLLAGVALAGAGGAAASPAWAQGAPVVSHPVVQSLPSADSKRLNTALATLGRNPRDVTALIEAGDAARALQDYAAALGFYRRADEASPGNARVKAGMGSAYVLSGDPVSAIPLFDEADKAGATPALMAGDRGLAYDLVGDNASAQRYYAMALASASAPEADELRNRLSVSQAIAGEGEAAYATLLPLLNKRDKPGWRTRAFTLAIAGETDEAVDVAGKILPAPLAQNIAPYLRYMPRLTKAQQAAAANLGRFPRASEVGRDDERIAAYAPPRASAAGSSLIPKGAPLGGAKLAKTAKASASRTRVARADTAQPGAGTSRPATQAAVDPDRVVPPDVKPTIERDTGELPPVASSVQLSPVAAAPRPVATPPAAAPMSAPTPAPKPATTVAPSTPRVAQATTPPASAASTPPASTPSASAPSRSSAPGFDVARMASSQAAPVVPPVSAPGLAARPDAAAPAAASTMGAPVPGPGQPSLAEIFADLGKPTVTVVPVPGAVDIRMITPAPPPPHVVPKVEEPKVAEGKADGAEPVDSKADAKAHVDPKVDPKVKPDPKAKAADAKAKDAKSKAAEAKLADAKAAEAKAAEAKAKAKKPVAPAHPSRIWVQIGVGRDKAAIAFDWRRYTRENAALFKGRQPYVSDMNRTNRILIGPFATQKAASAFISDAKKQGFGDALPWTSPAGQVVDPLSAK